MARSQSNGILKIAGAAAAAIVGGIAIGYLVGQVRAPHTVEQPIPQQTPAPEIKPPTPPVSPSSIHPRTANGNYTAPGAPDISIQEERQPVIRRVTPPATPKDSESTQESAPPVSVPGPSTAPTVVPAPDGSSTSPSTPSAGTGGDNSAPGSNTNTPSPKPAAPPADPDFEQVTPPTPVSDAEAGQDGSGKDTGKVQFRVQTGAYTDESNARSVADQLRGQGYATSTRSERVGDRLVYKVQVGAYRSKVGASKAADDLQKKGYPAYVSPIGP